MDSWKTQAIMAMRDGSFGITHNGMPYHVPGNAEFAALHKEVAAFAAANPAQVTPEAAPPAPTPKEIVDTFTWHIQRRLDAFARSEGKSYDNMLSLCSYATSTNPTFAKEGQYGVEARDATWAAANAILTAALASGTVPSWEVVEAGLPPQQWPDTSGL